MSADLRHRSRDGAGHHRRRTRRRSRARRKAPRIALEGAVEDLAGAGVRAGDFVVGIAASGTTPYVRRALEHARTLPAATALVACSPPPTETLDVVDILILPITGPEVVTGSTRMKAGTATKLVLNMITTGAMIRLGKTFGNLMVDLRATNDKLVDRSERILMEVCDVDRDRGARRCSSGAAAS